MSAKTIATSWRIAFVKVIKKRNVIDENCPHPVEHLHSIPMLGIYNLSVDHPFHVIRNPFHWSDLFSKNGMLFH